MAVNKKRKPKWLRITAIIASVLFLGLCIYGFMFYRSLSSALEDIHDPLDRKTDKRTEEVSLKKQVPFSILMLGVDERAGDKGRSDTMIVLTVNPNQNSVKMLSIPRDTRTEIIGRGKEDKINHAYAFGGPEMSMDTVENFLDIPIDYYMTINMEGFQEIVDAVGGVTVNNNLDFSYGGVDFPIGEISLDGQDALLYSQMRKEDPNGDFGRQQRQRLIIQGVIRKGASLNSITNYGSIFEALGNNVKTNITFSEMVDIQQNYKNASKNIEHVTISGTGTMINKIYYLVVSDEEKQRVQEIMKTHLELNKKAE
ncbi:polyisoprenyl-teichoic acid--peptidoglycan teichoic acid transferase TagU [Neobacillus sp. LXY-4]|uniref:polyisoprenyl-teichoic acid--peptidoglycan teichoic acid transferase TagU n=1 Tax=Neobacillus sp. LXY-4 TaxID=3379826 RepID=UPI003EE31386